MKQSHQLLISFFTPSYNRPNELYRTFTKINEIQNSKDLFEWIIVDDGSVEPMEKTFSQIEKEAKFKVKIIKKTNGGKSSAINVGAANSEGEWFFIIDDDDFIDSSILEKFTNDLVKFNETCVGITYRKKYFNGIIVGENIDPKDTFLELKPNRAGELFKGDLAYFFKTSVIKKFPFPKFKGEKFVPELYIWNKISDDGKIFYNTSIALYFCEYLETGLSNNFKSNLKRNPMGFFTFYFDQIKRSHSLFFFSKNLIRATQCLFYYLTKSRN
jgi:glycosyltransferase involved in cell wall biosynthesis